MSESHSGCEQARRVIVEAWKRGDTAEQWLGLVKVCSRVCGWQTAQALVDVLAQGPPLILGSRFLQYVALALKSRDDPIFTFLEFLQACRMRFSPEHPDLVETSFNSSPSRLEVLMQFIVDAIFSNESVRLLVGSGCLSENVLSDVMASALEFVQWLSDWIVVSFRENFEDKEYVSRRYVYLLQHFKFFITCSHTRAIFVSQGFIPVQKLVQKLQNFYSSFPVAPLIYTRILSEFNSLRLNLLLNSETPTFVLKSALSLELEITVGSPYENLVSIFFECDRCHKFSSGLDNWMTFLYRTIPLSSSNLSQSYQILYAIVIEALISCKSSSSSSFDAAGILAFLLCRVPLIISKLEDTFGSPKSCQQNVDIMMSKLLSLDSVHHPLFE
jgi:hypothetical protein